MTRVLFGILALMLVSACAWTPHDVAVTAHAPTTASSIGEGISLSLQVIDDRDSTVVGQRAGGMQGADITAMQVVPTLERELKAGFEAKGFRVLPANSTADVEVEARLRAFKFFIETGFFAGAENTSVVVGIEAEKPGDDYDRTYRSSSEKATMVVPAGSSIDDKLNASLSDVLRQIMSDVELMRFVTGRPSVTAAEIGPAAQMSASVDAGVKAETAETGGGDASAPGAAPDPCAHFISGQNRSPWERAACQ